MDYVAGRNRYMGYLISLGIYSFKGVKVGLDCANGSSWNIAKSVFDALGADTYVINAQPNGLNINNNAGSTHIEGLQKFVVEKGLDIGFAYEADGIAIEATARCKGETGVEMEALTAVSVAALTIYDMCKSHQRDMVIERVRLMEKDGGRSGHFVRED